METNKGLVTVSYSQSHKKALEEFCKVCDQHGYKNNNSLEAMRLDWCLSIGGQFFLTYHNNKIISVSGCHPLPQIGKDVYRILFRGATIPEFQNYLSSVSKTHMNSIPFFNHIPLEVNWGSAVSYKKFVITTNWNNPDIASMNKSHKVLASLAKQGIVSCLVDKVNLFYTDQSVWKINLKEYHKAREIFKKRHNLNG